ncbi:LysE family translocator [Candidatus Leptofilum sp.]|uniref:LysE family translocator n=1 Tax=Candidatus Leptofilum sp. TaxID=3241576 RepID=UPI003B5C950A
MFVVPVMYLVMSTLSPGPVTVLTIQNTTRYGRKAGTAVALGGALTTAVFVTVALFFTASNLMNVSLPTAHLYQKGGAIFILVMGLVTGYRCLFAKEKPQKELSSTNQVAKSFFTGMGLMTPYFPQAILFYTVILPHHMPTAELSSIILLMGLIKIALTISWYSLLSVTAKSIQDWFFNQRIQKFVEFTVACLLVGISVTMLTG